MMLIGPFYLIWFPALARDFFKLAGRFRGERKRDDWLTRVEGGEPVGGASSVSGV
jgi:hypothetical protein